MERSLYFVPEHASMSLRLGPDPKLARIQKAILKRNILLEAGLDKEEVMKRFNAELERIGVKTK